MANIYYLFEIHRQTEKVNRWRGGKGEERERNCKRREIGKMFPFSQHE